MKLTIINLIQAVRIALRNLMKDIKKAIANADALFIVINGTKQYHCNNIAELAEWLDMQSAGDVVTIQNKFKGNEYMGKAGELASLFNRLISE